MFLSRARPWALVGIIFAQGCSGPVATTRRVPDSVEYRLSKPYQEIRVFLTAEGGAGVVLVPPAGRGRTRRFVFPADPIEVQRVASMVCALLDSAPADQANALSRFPDQAKGMLVQYEIEGRRKTVRLPPRQVQQNYIWQGMAREIETIGLVELAQALNGQINAESRAAQNDLEGAIRLYEVAIETFRRWAEERCDRYDGPIWEPDVVMSFRYPHPHEAGGYYEVQGVPSNVMALPGMTAEWALKLLRYGWSKYTEDLILSRSDSTVTVSFVGFVQKEVGAQWTWGLPFDTIPPRALDLLRHDFGGEQ